MPHGTKILHVDYCVRRVNFHQVFYFHSNRWQQLFISVFFANVPLEPPQTLASELSTAELTTKLHIQMSPRMVTPNNYNISNSNRTSIVFLETEFKGGLVKLDTLGSYGG